MSLGGSRPRDHVDVLGSRLGLCCIPSPPGMAGCTGAEVRLDLGKVTLHNLK